MLQSFNEKNQLASVYFLEYSLQFAKHHHLILFWPLSPVHHFPKAYLLNGCYYIYDDNYQQTQEVKPQLKNKLWTVGLCSKICTWLRSCKPYLPWYLTDGCESLANVFKTSISFPASFECNALLGPSRSTRRLTDAAHSVRIALFLLLKSFYTVEHLLNW